MPYERFHKSFIAPLGGVNYSLPSNLKPDLFWYTLNDMQCLNGVTMPGPPYLVIATPAIAGAFIVKIYSYIKNPTTEFFILASDTKVYTYVPGTNTLTDITGAAVLTANYWSMTTFNGVLYMANEIEGVYKWDGTGNIAIIAAAPAASFITFFHEHLVALGNGTDKKAINWSNEFDDATWVPAATNDAGGFSFTDTDDNVCAYILGDNLIVYRRNSITMISYIGGDLVYLNKPLIEGAGAIGQNAVLVLPGRHIVLGSKFFFEYSGGDSINRDVGMAINPVVYQGQIDPGTSLFGIIAAGGSNGVLNIPSQSSAFWFYYTGDTNMMYHNYDTGVWSSPIMVTTDEIISAMNDSGSTSIKNYFASQSQVLQFAPEATDNSSGMTDCLAETRDIFLGQGAIDDNGEAINLPLDTIFTTESIDLEFNPVDLAPASAEVASIYIGYKNDLSAAYTWVTNSLGVIPAGTVQRLHWPVRVTGRWIRLRYVIPNHTQVFIAGFQINFFPNGNR